MLSVVDLSKTYSGHLVVDRVSLKVEAGEVRAVIGENGAGKTTLLKMLAGMVPPDSGRVMVNGSELLGRGRANALRAGVAMVTQELTAVPARSVIENVYLGRKASIFGPAQTHFAGEFESLCDRTGIKLDPRVAVGRLSLANRQLLEILRAMAVDPKVLLLDEPTTALGSNLSEQVRHLIRVLAREGKAVIWVSHRLSELRAHADQVTVMRDGRVVGEGAADTFTEETLVSLMVGHPVDVAYPHPGPVQGAGEPALKVRNFSATRGRPPVDFEVAKGEIVGCSGLIGSGRSSLMLAIFGDSPTATGEVSVAGGKWVTPKSARQMIRAGLAMVPEDRRREGLIPQMSVAENLILPLLERFTRLGFYLARRVRNTTAEWISEAGVKPANPSIPVGSLSGGNQQKVLVKRWMATNPKVVIFDEPTRGVSVDAKMEIHRTIIEAAERGAGVLLVSSELDEVLAMAHRIMVYRDGVVVGVYPRAEASREQVLAAAFGVTRSEIGDVE